MAQNNIRTVTFILEVNSRVAGFTNTSKELDKMHRELVKISKEMDKLEKAGKKDSTLYKELNQKAQQITGNLKEQIKAQAQYLSQLNLEQMSLNQLKVIRTQLRQTMSWAQADTREFREAAIQLKAVNEQMTRLKTLAGEAGQTFQGMGKFAGGITKLFAAFGLGVGVLTTIGNKAREVWQTLKDVSESYSDIRKVTNLSIPETTRLTSRLAGMDTRTSISERMQLAVVGGRMGIDGVSQLAEFAKVSDKIIVSLGDTLKGSADEIISKLAKIINAFDTGTTEGISFSEAMERVGSALNQIAAEGVASEEWQVDFLFRTGAIGRALNMSVQNMMGFGTVLEEAGNTVEVAGTAVSQFFGEISKNVTDYAEHAQMPVEKFIHLLETDANQALITVLKSIKDGAVSNTELVRTFSDLGIDGERATKVILSLANNIDKVTKKQKLANDEFDKNTSLTQEYEKRQVSIVGAMERIGNNIQRWFVRSGLESWLKSVFNWLAKISALKPSEELEKERIQLALTEAKLRDTNIKWEEKLELITELQSEYPGLFQNIQTEADLYATLADNMERANAALINKILIQRNQETISEHAGKAADAQESIEGYQKEVMDNFLKLKNLLSEEQIAKLPNIKGTSSWELRDYLQEFEKVAPQLAGEYRFTDLYRDDKYLGSFGRYYSTASGLISSIEYQERKKNYHLDLIKELSDKNKAYENAINTVLNPDGSSSVAPLTRQDYLETMRSVAGGGTVYRRYDPQLEKFLSMEDISEDKLKEFRDVLALEERVIAKAAKMGTTFTASGLQGEFIGNRDYENYSDFLRVRGTAVGLEGDDTGKGGKTGDDPATRARKLAEILAKMRQWGSGKQRSMDIDQMDDLEAQMAKLSDELQKAIDDYRAEYIAAAGEKITQQEQADLDRHVEDLEELKRKLLDVFDENYRQEMLDKMFDLTASDEDKAFRNLDKQYDKFFTYWNNRVKNATDSSDRSFAQSQLDALHAAYNRDFTDTVEKYKPEDQKRRENKEKQVRNAKLMYDGVTPDTAKETENARSVNELMLQLYGDNWQAMYDAHDAFLQSDYDNEMQFLKDRIQAQKQAEQELSDFKRNLATTTADSLARVATASINLEAERNNTAMQAELERYEGNERKQDQIRQKYARKEAELKAKQAVVDYLAGMIALVAKSWGQGGIFGGVIAGVQAAAYTAMLGIQLQQIKEAANAFADGKYDTIRTGDGKRYTARVKNNANRTQFVREPTYFTDQNALVGEQMPEIIISGPDTRYLRQMRPDVIDTIAGLPGARDFAAGRYPADVRNAPTTSGNTSGQDNRELIQALQGLQKKMETPFMGVIVADEKNALSMQKALNRLSKRQQNARKF